MVFSLSHNYDNRVEGLSARYAPERSTSIASEPKHIQTPCFWNLGGYVFGKYQDPDMRRRTKVLMMDRPNRTQSQVDGDECVDQIRFDTQLCHISISSITKALLTFEIEKCGREMGCPFGQLRPGPNVRKICSPIYLSPK
jgi:hypothetical protein